jgi:hypothetical protein
MRHKSFLIPAAPPATSRGSGCPSGKNLISQPEKPNEYTREKCVFRCKFSSVRRGLFPEKRVEMVN